MSAPESAKARLTQRWLAEHRPDIGYLCPQLSSYPKQAKSRLRCLLEETVDQQPVLIGSSLGGYWATWLSETYDVPAVLINPAVAPSMLFPEYIGVELKNFYTNETYLLEQDDIDELAKAEVPRLQRPERFWLIVQTGDETLDYRLAVKKYAMARQLVEEGGSHSFDNYDRWLPSIIDFLESTAARSY